MAELADALASGASGRKAMRVRLSLSAQNHMPLNWKNFIESTKNRQPHKLLTDSIEILEIPRGAALDIGCGPGVDAKYLAENGFTVEALDFSEDSVKQTRELCKNLNVTVLQESINDFAIEAEKYSLIFSWNTLPYLQKTEAENVLRKSYAGMAKYGTLIFTVFGAEDDWVKSKEAESFFTIEEVKDIFKGAEIIKAEEIKEQKVMPSGKNKFWHLLKFVIRK